MPVLSVLDLNVEYHTNHIIRAVSDVTLDLEAGRCLCVVGETGSGKSTLARAIARVLPPNARITRGKVTLDGMDVLEMNEKEFNNQIRWKKLAVVFQSAISSLNPFMRVGDQIIEVMTRHLHLTKGEARERAKELLTSVKVPPSRIDVYPHELSGGMRQRVAIAVALACNPKVVIADEPTTGLDVTTSAQIGTLLIELVKKGLGLMLITHDIGFAAMLADHVAVMYGGRIVEYSPTSSFVKNPIHPYSIALLNSIPRLGDSSFKPASIPGNPVQLWGERKGCSFAPRCPYAKQVCHDTAPPMVEVDGSRAECHYAGRLSR